MTNLREQAALCLNANDPARKCVSTIALNENPPVIVAEQIIASNPGRPSRPDLVDPRNLSRRRISTRVGHAALIHAICHIEFTAINLALDALVRFPDMPHAYYLDWLSVAAEEAEHFTMLHQHLNSLAATYGDFDAHDGLWDMAERTSNDVLQRMALVPRVMEARGLDVTPPMIARLEQIGDVDGVRILNRILTDEIRHVRIGSDWFRYVCAERQLEPEVTFNEIVIAEFGAIRGKAINREARLKAGFSQSELDTLVENQAVHRGELEAE